jgi:pimeloyl-ACP methyl ester carboxylesterase
MVDQRGDSDSSRRRFDLLGKAQEMKLELLHESAKGDAKETPILFVHGKWHGAWCWQDHFMPYFARKGYDVYAVSLRGHGNSEGREKLRWHSISDYAEDVHWAVNEIGKTPIIVAHSMGGFITQKYLETHQVPAAALLTPVPYYGLWGSTLNLLLRHPWMVIKAIGTMSLYPVVETPELAREGLFSNDIADKALTKYYQQLQDESFRAYLDELGLNLVSPKRVKTPILVLGAENDTVISSASVYKTARAYQGEPIMLPNTAHDVMLESNWQGAADHIVSWLHERGL